MVVAGQESQDPSNVSGSVNFGTDFEAGNDSVFSSQSGRNGYGHRRRHSAPDVAETWSTSSVRRLEDVDEGKGVKWGPQNSFSLGNEAPRKLERKLSLADGVNSAELLSRLNNKDIDTANRWQDALHIADESRIHRDIQHLSGIAYFQQRRIALICSMCVALAIWINELCSAREYVPEEEREQLVLHDHCEHKYAESLKFVHVGVTLVLIVKIWFQHNTALHLKRLELQLLERRRSKYAAAPLLCISWATPHVIFHFFLELLLCAPCNIPFVHYRYDTEVAQDREVTYRLEAVICALTFLRLFHIWRLMHMQVSTYRNPTP